MSVVSGCVLLDGQGGGGERARAQAAAVVAVVLTKEQDGDDGIETRGRGGRHSLEQNSRSDMVKEERRARREYAGAAATSAGASLSWRTRWWRSLSSW